MATPPNSRPFALYELRRIIAARNEFFCSQAGLTMAVLRRRWTGLLHSCVALLGVLSTAQAQLDNHNLNETKVLKKPEANKSVGSVPEANTSVALVRVRLPITGNADQILQSILLRVRDDLLSQARLNTDSRRPLLVLQFDPPTQNDNPGSSSQFERALSLARFLCTRQMSEVKTVAFVPRTIRGHGTLLALSCEEIVMAPDALLGEAAANETDPGTILDAVVPAYRVIAETKRTIPVALAIGMIDAKAEVLQVKTEQGIDFVLREDFDNFAADRVILEENTLVPSGSLAEFDGREGRQFGFVKYLASNREGLARALGLTAESLQERDLLAENWKPVLVDIEGPITAQLASQIESLVGRELAQANCNWIGVRIDSAGGDMGAGVRIASFLAHLDSNTVRTVAYVPEEASGGAAIIALSCDQLVMHQGAELKARNITRQQQQFVFADDLDAARQAIRESLASGPPKNWSLLTAMIDPSIELYEYHNKKTGEKCLMSSAEAGAKEDSDDWQKREPLLAGQEPLVLDNLRAEQHKLAWRTVESFDQLIVLYGLEQEPRVLKPNWALELVEALASPGVAAFLLTISFFGIYFELRAPGIGVGAFISAVGFLLFFWSMYLNGTAGWLEVILLLAGICFILLEIFVLPGFGIFGLGGGIMIIASVILASVTFVWPHSEAEISELTHSVGTVGVAIICVIALATISRHYLPYAPLFRNVVLEPPLPEERAVLNQRETLVDYTNLIGICGVAATDLRPAGKATIDHELIDVISEGEPLEQGTPVIVVDAHANRVVVRAVGPT